MSEVSKVPNTVLLIKDQRACQRCRRCETLYCNTNKGSKGYVCRRCRKWCLWLLHNTAYRVLLLMSEVLKVIVLCIQWSLTPARREGYLSLLSWGFSSLRMEPPLRKEHPLKMEKAYTGHLHCFYTVIIV